MVRDGVKGFGLKWMCFNMKWVDREKERMRKAKRKRQVMRNIEKKEFERAKLKGMKDRAKAKGYAAGRTTMGDKLLNYVAGPPPKRSMPKTRKPGTKKRSKKRHDPFNIFEDGPIV